MNATILAGLPGDGPVPIYFHAGRPTPWREGLAVRFEREGKNDIVGNFQCGNRDYSSTIPWDQASAVICVARGFLYLVPYATPEAYKTFVGSFGAVALSPSSTTLYGIDEARVLAFDSDLNTRWNHQKDLWRYGPYLVLNRVEDGSILVSAQFDLEGPWTEYLLAEHDGKLLRVGTDIKA